MRLRVVRLQRRNRKVAEDIADVAMYLSYKHGVTYTAELNDDRLACG
jgi:hypothetical protein